MFNRNQFLSNGNRFHIILYKSVSGKNATDLLRIASAKPQSLLRDLTRRIPLYLYPTFGLTRLGFISVFEYERCRVKSEFRLGTFWNAPLNVPEFLGAPFRSSKEKIIFIKIFREYIIT